jgi:glycerate dehydrogenase
VKIVVLDGYALNPGDLSWDRLKSLGEVEIYDRTPEPLILERASGAEVLLTNKTPLDKTTLSSLSRLRYIGVLATGYNVVDVEEAKKRNITVTNVPAYSTLSVAQMVFAHILEFCHHVQDHSTAVRSGAWSKSKDFCFWNRPLTELSGKTLGIIGFGRIGQKVAEVAKTFDMKVAVYSRSKKLTGEGNVIWTDLDELLRISDFISLHCPLTEETKGMINKESLGKMKKTAILINTSRGGLVIDRDLADALNGGIIAGAGLDVLSVEPPEKDNPLLTAKNCIITPHIAWATIEARTRLMDIAVDNLIAFLEGKPVNTV